VTRAAGARARQKEGVGFETNFATSLPRFGAMSVGVEISRGSVVKAFKAIQQDVQEDEIIEKCQRICQEHDLSPLDLVYKWEAYMDSLQREALPDVKHFDSIENAMIKALRDKEAKLKSAKTAVKVSTRVPIKKETIGILQDQLASNYGSGTQKVKLEAPSTPVANSFVTPAKRARPLDTPSSLPSSSRPRMLPTPAGKDFLSTPAETPEAMKYSEREQKLKVLSSLNEALAPADPVDCKSSRCELKVLKGIQLHKGGQAVLHRYMFERIEHKCVTLRNRLRETTDGIVMRNNLRAKALEEDGGELQMSPVNMPSQEKGWYCGRICCEGDSGSINASSVLLEGANGRRVRLDFGKADNFGVFPGQIVVLRGNNTSGESILVQEIWSDAALPMVKTPADKMATWNETDAFLGGLPLSMVMASGPFTCSSDLTYKPLEDLLGHVAQQKPDVLILTGPFVDCKHRLLNPDAAGTAGGFSGGNPPDSLQVVRHVMRDLILERLATCSPTTSCVLVPCLDDLHSRTTFPQPPFDHAEVLSAVQDEADVAQRVDVQLVGNPCVLRINEILVGICTADPIRSLSANEASRSTGDRITRLASHLVQQRSFYPLFPPAEGCQLSMANVEHLGLEHTPDVMLLPSQITPFAKRIGDVLCINPGKLTKGSGPGTFARVTVHPVVRHLRSGAAGGSRKVTAGLALSPSALVESPDKAEEAAAAPASEAGASMSPQQLSDNFESAAAADSKAQEEGKQTPGEALATEAACGETITKVLDPEHQTLDHSPFTLNIRPEWQTVHRKGCCSSQRDREHARFSLCPLESSRRLEEDSRRTPGELPPPPPSLSRLSVCLSLTLCHTWQG
jgi:DNA polymerase alpha subunit B